MSNHGQNGGSLQALLLLTKEKKSFKEKINLCELNLIYLWKWEDSPVDTSLKHSFYEACFFLRI